MITTIRESVCPHCKTHLDAATLASGNREDKPRDGDITMCLECGGFAIVEEDAPGGCRLPTAAETDALNRTGMIHQLVKTWRDFKHGA